MSTNQGGSPPRPRCPFCGGTAFTWGNVVMKAFYPEPKQGNKRLLMPGKPIELARHCDTCGNVQFYTKKRFASS